MHSRPIDLAMERCFVVISGLPGSGKSTLARQLAAALDLPLLDKDEILEHLFESKGVGSADWRRTLSRESDGILQAKALASSGAVLVSHWRLPGMPVNSGTPTEWLEELAARIVIVDCRCDAELAAKRFVQRQRHPGHLDSEKSLSEIRAGIEQVAAFGRLSLKPRVDVDTSRPVRLDRILRDIVQALQGLDVC